MPAPATINLAAADGGLDSCFQSCQVPNQVQEHFKMVLNLVKLKDFLLVVSKRDYEKELKAIVEG